MTQQNDTVLEVHDLKSYFRLDEGLLKAVDGADFSVRRHRTLGLVGESGCGKSVAALSVMRLLPKYAITSGQALLRRQNKDTVDLLGLHPTGPEVRAIRGGEISMIFQEPITAFSPVHTIGDQIMEGILLHATQDRQAAYDIAVGMLRRVKMANPEQRMREYPHELSGGMRQRAMIAMALACHPSVLIADEPTTSLDVTVQAQVLELIHDLQRDLGMAVMFITHDLGVIAEMADEVAVMYLGKVVELCSVDDIFYNPLHPYTRALLRSIPAVGAASRSQLATIRGTVPVPINRGEECGFYERCEEAVEGLCDRKTPLLVQVDEGHLVRCFHRVRVGDGV